MGDEPSRREGPSVETPRPPTGEPARPDPLELLRSRSYLTLLVLGAVVGVPVAAVAYLFLAFVSKAQHFVFVSLPEDLGLGSAPLWWPVLPLLLSGLIVGLTLKYLHGTAGHKPAEGFKSGGATDPRDLPGIVLASLATLSLGAVLGPEAPLIAIGSGLGVLAVRLVKRDAPQAAVGVIAGAGSFAAISTLLGSPPPLQCRASPAGRIRIGFGSCHDLDGCPPQKGATAGPCRRDRQSVQHTQAERECRAAACRACNPPKPLLLVHTFDHC